MKKTRRVTETELKQIVRRVIQESMISEGLGGFQIATFAADEAAFKISEMLIDEYGNFVGPSQTGGIKNYFMRHFNKSLNNMILNSSNEMENDL
jgi:hypothetical protein